MKPYTMLFALPLMLLCLGLSSCAEPELIYADTEAYEAPRPKINFLALGDSYTIGQSVAEADRWPNLLSAKLQADAWTVERTNIIARTGWTTGNLISAIQTQKPDSNYNLVGLLIGVNNQYQGRSLAEYETQFAQLLNTAIALAGGKKQHVFVVSIPDYGYTPFGQGSQATISAELDQFNAANLRITQNQGIPYFDITPISRQGLNDPALVANDGLHPSGKQYAAWADLIYPGILELLGK